MGGRDSTRGKAGQSPCCTGGEDPTENNASLTKALQSPLRLPSGTVCSMRDTLFSSWCTRQEVNHTLLSRVTYSDLFTFNSEKCHWITVRLSHYLCGSFQTKILTFPQVYFLLFKSKYSSYELDKAFNIECQWLF